MSRADYDAMRATSDHLRRFVPPSDASLAPAKETSPLLEVVTDSSLPPMVRVPGNIQDVEAPSRKLSKAEKLEKKQKKKDKNFRCVEHCPEASSRMQCPLRANHRTHLDLLVYGTVALRSARLRHARQIAEIVGGYFAHSLAIMTDAAHLATDVGALLLRYACR